MGEVELSYARVLTIAGSDSSGGAGIQADIKTIAALGCYGMCAITAVTAQNTLGVSRIHGIPIEVLRSQIDAVVDDIGVDAVKVGMLHSIEVMEEVARAIDDKGLQQVVLDPVMVSATGARLMSEGAMGAIVDLLIPRAQLITPNLDEAALLLGRELTNSKALVAGARELLGLGAQAVLLKGAHLIEAGVTDILDVLVMRSRLTGAVEVVEVESKACGDIRVEELRSPRIASHNLHGAGCTLSAAVASYLALGLDMPTAVQAARVYVLAAIEAGMNVRTGQGVGPLNHGYAPMAMRVRS